MSGKKQDARVRYTKMMVKSSLLELMQTKPVAKITVTEICEKAGINRATFYSHYSDPTDLLHSIERELIEDISRRVQPAIAALGGDLKDSMTEIVEYVRENAEACRALLSDQGDTGFQNQVVRVVEKQFIEHWRANSSASMEDAEYIYTFIAIGSVGVIRKWLAEGTVKPSGEVADIIIKLSSAGFMSLAG